MADEIAKPAQVKPLTKEEAVKAYYDAKDAKSKAEVVAANPVLNGVFSTANHS